MLSEQKIREIIAETNTKHDWSKVDKNATFDELDLDSLDHFDLIVGLQSAAGIDVPDDDVEKLSSIATVERYFADK